MYEHIEIRGSMVQEEHEVGGWEGSEGRSADDGNDGGGSIYLAQGGDGGGSWRSTVIDTWYIMHSMYEYICNTEYFVCMCVRGRPSVATDYKMVCGKIIMICYYLVHVLRELKTERPATCGRRRR